MKFRRTVVIQSAAVVVSLIGIATVAWIRGPLLHASLTEQEVHAVVDIAVEHTLPVIVNLRIGRVRGNAIIEVSQQSGETVLISLPEDWQRREVRDALLSDVTAEDPIFGFARWNIPPDATVSFLASKEPEQIVMHNPSGVPLQVLLTDIDLAEETVRKDVVLILEGTSPLL